MIGTYYFFLKSLSLKISKYDSVIRKKGNIKQIVLLFSHSCIASRDLWIAFFYLTICVKWTRIINSLLKCEETSWRGAHNPKNKTLKAKEEINISTFWSYGMPSYCNKCGHKNFVMQIKFPILKKVCWFTLFH